MPNLFVCLHGKSSENLDHLSCLLLPFYFPKLEILKNYFGSCWLTVSIQRLNWWHPTGSGECHKALPSALVIFPILPQGLSLLTFRKKGEQRADPLHRKQLARDLAHWLSPGLTAVGEELTELVATALTSNLGALYMSDSFSAFCFPSKSQLSCARPNYDSHAFAWRKWTLQRFLSSRPLLSQGSHCLQDATAQTHPALSPIHVLLGQASWEAIVSENEN